MIKLRRCAPSATILSFIHPPGMFSSQCFRQAAHIHGQMFLFCGALADLKYSYKPVLWLHECVLHPEEQADDLAGADERGDGGE